MNLEQMEELLLRLDGDPVTAGAYTTQEGWARLQAALSSWQTVYRPMERVDRSAHGIPVILDAALPPDVIEFRDRAGNVLKRITLDPPR